MEICRLEMRVLGSSRSLHLHSSVRIACRSPSGTSILGDLGLHIAIALQWAAASPPMLRTHAHRPYRHRPPDGLPYQPEADHPANVEGSVPGGEAGNRYPRETHHIERW